MSEERNTRVLIIGAGLTGLTLAYYLKKAGIKTLMADKSAKTGGVIHTEKDQGFVYETGPNTGVLSTPDIVELFEDLNKHVRIELPDPVSKSRWIWKKGRWNALPSGLLQAVSTPLFSTCDKFRILGEPFRKKGSDPDESVAELVRRRLGKSYLEYAVDPFISGIYAGDPEQLVTRYALPKLYNLEQQYGSFIRGAIKMKSEHKDDRDKKATREIFSSEGGLQSLIDALTTETGHDNILLNCSEIMIRPENDHHWKTILHTPGGPQTIHSNTVVTTVGSYSLPGLLDFISPDLLAPFGKLKYAGVVQAAVGYNRWNGIKLNAFGGLFPSAEGRNTLGILFPSSIFKGRAPENGALLSIFLGGMKNHDIIHKTDQEIVRMITSEINTTLSLKGDGPDMIKIFRYSNAIPQYERSTGERLRTIEQIQKLYPGLILAGNVRDGIGMADRVKQAKQIAISLKE